MKAGPAAIFHYEGTEHTEKTLRLLWALRDLRGERSQERKVWPFGIVLPPFFLYNFMFRNFRFASVRGSL